ncbi:zinc ribbon domain-containing protein [Amycolatopsis lurida]
MRKLVCPYCYHEVSLSALHFQCHGRGSAAGNGCRKRVDENRRQLTGYALESWPTFPAPGRAKAGTCPECGAVSRIRACPTCHTTLPTTFGEDPRSPLVGLIGGKGAGKTVFLTVLMHELQHAIRRRFGADTRLIGDQHAGEASTKRWFETYERALFVDKVLPETTRSAIDGVRAPIVFEWRTSRRRFARRARPLSSTLSFYDAAGEDMTTQDSVYTQHYLRWTSALIVVLDPWQLPGARGRITVPDNAIRENEPPQEVLNRVTEALRQREDSGLIRVPMAVVFAKMDSFFDSLGPAHPLMRPPAAGPAYDERAGAATHDHVLDLLGELGADAIDSHLRLNYRKYRYFAVSALGATPDYASNSVNARGIQPHRVDEPLLWLLSLSGIVGRTRK